MLGKATDLIVRLFGGDPFVQRSEIDEDELRELAYAPTGSRRVDDLRVPLLLGEEAKHLPRHADFESYDTEFVL